MPAREGQKEKGKLQQSLFTLRNFAPVYRCLFNCVKQSHFRCLSIQSPLTFSEAGVSQRAAAFPWRVLT